MPRICTSAGHGKNSRHPGQYDPGAEVVGPGVEATYVLEMARNLDADYEALGIYSVLVDAMAYYKADDVAAANRCDTFDELHTNAARVTKRDGKKMGVEVLYEDAKDLTYAVHMSAAIAKAAGLPDRGAKRRFGLAVLEPRPHMRQVIIEMFFGSDPDDVAAYNANKTAVECAIVNTNLKTWRWPTLGVKTPPRKWSAWRKRWYRLRRLGK